jgi:hypothetical protein
VEKRIIKSIKKIKTKTSSEKIADYIIWGLEGLTLTGKVHKTKSNNNSEFEMLLTILEFLIK